MNSDIADEVQQEVKNNYGIAIAHVVIEKGLDLIEATFPPGKFLKIFGSLFIDSNKAIENENEKAERKVVMEYLVKLNESVNEISNEIIMLSGEHATKVYGDIRVNAENSKKVIGASINSTTHFMPGSSVQLELNNVDNAIGIKIGGQTQ